MNIIKVFKKEVAKMKEKNWDCIYVLVDIHGTSFSPSYNNEETYEFYPYAVEALQMLSRRKDVKIILWSSTDRKTLNKYHIELCNNDIYVDYFNTNPEVDGSTCDINTASFVHKPYFNIGIDDRFGFEPEKDWQSICSFLRQKEIDDGWEEIKNWDNSKKKEAHDFFVNYFKTVEF